MAESDKKTEGKKPDKAPKPEQAALRSNAPALVAPSAFCTRQAVAGKLYSGVVVAQMIRSILLGGRSATARARRAATTARDEVVSLGSAATWRSSMPVRERIHSSDVATIRSMSALVITRSGA